LRGPSPSPSSARVSCATARATRPSLGLAVATAALPAVLVLTVVAAFTRFLGVGFVGTDSLTLVETSRVGSWSDVGALFAQPVMAGTTFAQGEVVYRPFVSLTFAVEHAVWGLDPLGYHATNLALHGLTTLAVWALLRGLHLSRPASLIGGLLFGLHPLVVATVPVLARRDSLVPVAAFTGAMALLCHGATGGGRRWPWTIGSLLLYGIALLSKESAFAALLLVPAVLACVGVAGGLGTPPARVALVRRVIPYGVLTVVVFALRFAVLGSLGGYRGTSIATLDTSAYRAVVTGFARFLLWPVGELFPRGSTAWAALLAVVLLALTAASSAMPTRPGSVVRVGCLWIAVFAVFYTVVKTLSGAWLAYFPLVGLALIAAGVVQALPSAIRALDSGDPPGVRLWRGGAPLFVAAGLALFSLATLRSSPLMEAYPEWDAAHAITARYLAAAVECARSEPDLTVLTLTNVPNLLDYPDRASDLLAPTLVSDNTVQAALDAFLPSRSVAVVAESYGTVLWSAEPLRLSCSGAGAGRRLAAE